MENVPVIMTRLYGEVLQQNINMISYAVFLESYYQNKNSNPPKGKKMKAELLQYASHRQVDVTVTRVQSRFVSYSRSNPASCS